MRFRAIAVWVLWLWVFFVPVAFAQHTPAPADMVRLADLIAEAERNHPSIHAAARGVQAKRARIAQARAWPDPEVSVGYMGRAIPFRTMRDDPSTFRQFGVMQAIPYPGKRDLRGQIARKDADAESWTVEEARRRIRAEVQAAYYELWATDMAIRITEKNKDLLEKLARITEEKYKVGKGLQQDVLRAQVEVTRVVQRLALLGQRRATLETQLNSLLVRPPDTPLGPLAPFEKAPLAYSLEELLEHAVQGYPAVQRQEQLIEQSRLAVNLAQKDYYPDFAVGWDYANRPGMPEMYGLRFSMNLPVFNKGRRREAVREATETLASARHLREAIRTELFFRVKEYYLAARTADELLTLYAKGIVPQSTLALESALAAYQVGSVDFLSLMTNFTTVLDYEVSYYLELANYQKALARLEEITGLELTK